MKKLEYIKDQASKLFDKYELYGWDFEFDTATSRYGCCWNGRKLITLSKGLVELNTLEQSMDTLLHEIAHALTPNHNHDKIWKLKCIEIGANPERCYKSEQVITPPKKYIVKCPQCDYNYETMRRRKGSVFCGFCYEKNDNNLNYKFKLVTKINNKYRKEGV